MQKLRTWTGNAGTGPLVRSQRLHHSSALLAANTRAQSEISDVPKTRSDDPRGQAMRQLREHLQLDAVLLATQACISLRQLYQLESGESSLFYNSALRDQAGRRVASLLGQSWETLGQKPLPIGQDTAPKVVSLHSAQATAQPAENPAHAAHATSAAADEAPPIGLQREATETLTLPPPATAQIRPLEPPTEASAARPSHWPRTLTLWTLAAFLGITTGWLIATQPQLYALISVLLDQLH